jgi:DNA repair protein SbcC/Rad50
VILVSLEIENYKQFVGRHEILPGAQGIVGVVGPNGVGKTTLFEAIEWCLYNPGSIRNEDVPPRAGVGQTLVRVTLEDPRDGIQYVVERRLKSKHVTADVYRVDEPENRLVQGSRQVSDYVARRLIGLSHRAFVSTFFTRQKELSFFGGLKETERRREVARLLGLETIRVAQQSISAERAEAQAEARSLRAQHANEVAGRDFARELEDADSVVATAQERVRSAEALVVASAQATTAARTELDRWRALQDEDNALALELTRVQGDEQTAQARRDNAANDLARIDQAIADRAKLFPIAAAEAERSAAVTAHEAERDRHLRREQLLAERRRSGDVLRKTIDQVERAVHLVPTGPGVPAGWAWLPEDAGEPFAGAERLVGLAESLDVDSACERETELVLCARLVEQRNEATAKATRYRTHLNRLHAELAGLLAGGDPREQVEAADGERAAALASAEAASARLRADGEERGRLQRIVDALRAADFAHGCPTCARPFTPDQVDETAAVLSERIEHLRETERAATRERDDALARAKQLDATRTAALEVLSKADTLRGRIGDGEAKVVEAEQEAEKLAHECGQALKRNGLTLDPTIEEVERAKIVADRVQRVAGSLPLLRQLRSTIAASMDEAKAADRRLGELGPVAYDPTAHETADQALAEARAAAARIGELDRQIARRPEIETDRAGADADLCRLAKERANLEKQRAAVGFDPAGLAAAVAAEREAREAEKSALDERQASMTALAQAEHRRSSLAVEHERIAGLAARADVRGREADELDRMYKEFTRFDQYVAERVTPQLAEHTGELLAAVTEGKYDRVTFDENYGLEIFDGEEHFPIGSFSGGERDVAALCARLALSRLVGGQAGHPPEFLVLDEVFGSLDRERRSQVMEMLGTLAGNTDVFRQLFIISHVDDVRASSVFNQVWRLSESEEGVSQFEDITEAGGADEL